MSELSPLIRDEMARVVGNKTQLPPEEMKEVGGLN